MVTAATYAVDRARNRPPEMAGYLAGRAGVLPTVL